MTDFLIDLLKSVSAIIFSLLATVILVVIDALLVGYGIYKDWQWMTNGGVFLAVLGLMFIFRHWWIDDQGRPLASTRDSGSWRAFDRLIIRITVVFSSTIQDYRTSSTPGDPIVHAILEDPRRH